MTLPDEILLKIQAEVIRLNCQLQCVERAVCTIVAATGVDLAHPLSSEPLPWLRDAYRAALEQRLRQFEDAAPGIAAQLQAMLDPPAEQDPTTDDETDA